MATHSEVARDPWRRYQATVAFMSSVTYGEADEASAAVRRVRAVHDTVRGIDSTGAAYTANDPALLAYVHSTLVDSALTAADVYGPRLPPSERDRYVVEMARVARMLGLADPPETAAAASAVIMTADGRARDAAGTRSRVAARAAAHADLDATRRTACCSRARSTSSPASARSTSGSCPVWGVTRPAVRASTNALDADDEPRRRLAPRPPRPPPRRPAQLPRPLTIEPA